MAANKPTPASASRPTWAKDLTEIEQLFVREYLKDFNGKAAMLRVKPNLTDASATVAASETRQRPHVARAIDDALREDSSGPRQWLITKLRAWIDADITELMEWDDDGKVTLIASKNLPKELSILIKKIVRTKDGEVRFELHDPMKAIEQMAKIARLHQIPSASESEGDVLEKLIYAALELKHKRESGE